MSEDSQNSEEFEGQFENEEIVHGRYVSETGDSYDGDWLDGRSHGKGKYRFVDGEEYEGDWKDGKMHGNGTYHYSDGDRWLGCECLTYTRKQCPQLI